MLDSSIDFIPYSDTIEQIVFLDSLGNEVIAKIGKNVKSMVSILYLEENACEQDTMQKFQYTSKIETKHVEFLILELDIRLSLRLGVRVAISSQNLDPILLFDQINIGLHTPVYSFASNSKLNITVDARNFYYYTTDTPNSAVYNLHGMDFYNVYHIEMDIPEGKFNLFYNEEKGLIGFENHDKTISYKYEYVQ